MCELLKMVNISKSFTQNLVLNKINFDVRAGEVHALMGENGAGKSTAIKILGGVYKPDGGDIFLKGEKLEINNVSDARANGISVIHQELMLMQHLSVAENLFMGREIRRGHLGVDLEKEYQEAQEILDTFGMKINAKTQLSSLTIAQQQMVEIIRAVSFNAEVIAMDEPTSSLSEYETEILFRVIGDLKKRGIGIILVSHRISDILKVADRITVLRDGNMVDTVNISDVTSDDIIRMMVGRELSNYYVRHEHKIGEKVLEVTNLCDGGSVKDVSFAVHRGEILGISGLVGAGRSETLNCIFGLAMPQKGSIRINGAETIFKNPNEAIKAGLGFVCEDRKQSGLFLKQNVKFNISINALSRIINRLKYKNSAETELAQNYIERMNIRVTDKNQITMFLSGGNQQKTLIARWLVSTKQILLLDEPTRGVDVKTKQEIYRLIDDLALAGMTIVFVSSELQELLNVCDRITVISNGKTTGTLNKDEFDQETILKLATKEFTA